MPAVTQVILYSDPDWPEQVLAQEVVRLTVHWQDIGGAGRGRRDVELYLTGEARRQLLEKDLGSWFALGHRPGGVPHQDSPAPARTRWKGGSRTASVDRHRKIREFITERDIRSRVDASRLAFETPSGSWSYPKWAVALYEQWVADGCPPLRQAS